MLLLAPADMVRVMGGLVRRADAGLARTAAHNAALGLADHHARRMDEARTLRDLRQLRGPVRLTRR